MKLIVGLGNPGREYVNTRHNAGYMAIERIADFVGVEFNKKKFNGIYTDFTYDGEKYLLLKPEKYMNLSGEVIRDYVNFFKIDIDDVLIIHDDLDTPIGTYRLRYKGGNGGHNGLKNIEENLSTKNYKRIKIGISNDKLMDTKDYVLGKFSKEDLELLENVFKDIVEIFKIYNKYSFDNIMNKFNTKE